MKNIALIALTMTALVACKKQNQTKEQAQPTVTDTIKTEEGAVSKNIKIRLHNNTAYVMRNILVFSPTDRIELPYLNPSESSDYHAFEKAYNFATVSFDIEGKTYKMQPIDFVNEKVLPDGNYTYQLGVENLDSNQAILDVKVD